MTFGAKYVTVGEAVWTGIGGVAMGIRMWSGIGGIRPMGCRNGG